MRNLASIKKMEQEVLLYAEDRDALSSLVLIAVEVATPYQCRACIKRMECPKKGVEEFCMDWERSFSEQGLGC